MPAQARNVSEAALRPLPTTREFLETLGKAIQPKPAPADAALFGPLYAKPPQHRPGTVRNHKQAYKAAIEFEAVCIARGTPLTNLDDWMVGFAHWTLHPQYLLDDSTQLDAAMAQREAFAKEANVAVHRWTPVTLKTIVNALAHLHKQGEPEVGIVPGVAKQFPNYCLAFNEALARCKSTKL